MLKNKSKQTVPNLPHSVCHLKWFEWVKHPNDPLWWFNSTAFCSIFITFLFNWIKFERELNNNWTEVEQKFNRIWTDSEHKLNKNWTEMEQELNGNWTKIEQKWNWNGTQIEQKFIGNWGRIINAQFRVSCLLYDCTYTSWEPLSELL